MERVKTLIIDDEEGNVIFLKGLIERFIPEIEVIGRASNKTEGIELIEKLKPQLIFLDIEMPYGTGFDLLDHFDVIKFETIFITAYDNYAIKAFKFAATDYLLKPVNLEELKQAVEKAIKKINLNQKTDSISVLLQNMKPQNHSQTIGIHESEGLTFIKLEQIVKLEADGSYTIVYKNDGSKIVSTKKLKDFEDMLPEQTFFRIHHSFIINLNYLKSYFKGRGGYVEMQDGSTVAVSTRKKEDFLKRMTP